MRVVYTTPGNKPTPTKIGKGHGPKHHNVTMCRTKDVPQS